MSRHAALAVFLLALSALFFAAHSAAIPPPDEIAEFQQNLPLIQALVESSVRLVRDDDPLLRAESCVKVASQFSAEMRQAAQQHDAVRAVEMSKHLHNLIERGVAPNLMVARQQIPQGSTAEAKLRQVRERALSLLRNSRGALQGVVAGENADEVRQALDNLLQKHADLEQTLRPTSSIE